MKLLFFLTGFYCSTAFATVIGQTGDWDILSAALAVAVVEGIGALMYTGSFPLFNKVRNLITMFNYWKGGLTMGLFLDSFKWEFSDVIKVDSFETGILAEIRLTILLVKLLQGAQVQHWPKDKEGMSWDVCWFVGWSKCPTHFNLRLKVVHPGPI
ncbi:hypothetical protein E3N88_16934 [Mikania micrantha]|uniref:Ycf20-like protein n=1 Tax=Mikania micrantha TaxID=192012 RepID=A0A5N6NT20_9ASTR|nr:hypothetical protein E3N88_16934 [Mikania micrantha]